MASARPDILSHFDAEEESASSLKRSSDVGGVSVGRLMAWIPRRVWNRVIALGLILFAIKLLVIAHLSKQLFEVHWRTGGTLLVPGDYVNFAIFVFIGALTLARLAHECQSIGAKAARLANRSVLCLAIPFLFLTFHQGNNNYLFPILSGVLRWTSLGPYLADDFFFNPPFLSLWLAAYGLGYYVLRRSGRESHCLYLTTAFAAVYAPTFLSHLAVYRNELLALNLLGGLCLLNSLFSSKPLKRSSLVLPPIWTVLGAGCLLWRAPGQLGVSLGYFSGLCVVTGALVLLTLIIAKRGGYGGLWTKLAFFYGMAFLLLADTAFPVAPNFNLALCSGLEFSRYFLGEVVVCLLLLVTGGLVSRLLPWAREVWLDLLAPVLIAVTLIDYRVLQVMGVRLEWNLLELGNSPTMMWKMAKPYLPMLALVLAGIVGVYFVIVYLVGKQLSNGKRDAPSAGCNERREGLTAECRMQKAKYQRPAPGFVAAVFIGLGLLGALLANSDKAQGQAVLRLTGSSPLWSRVALQTMSPEEFQRTTAALKLGTFKPANLPAATATRDLNVVLVFMESTYNKHLSLFGGTEETEPLLSKYRERMELYPNFFSTFASSIHARFATFCGLYPTRDFNTFTLQRVGVKSIFEVLHENGYETSLFYSSFLDFTGFRDFLANRGVDHVYDADSMPGRRHTEPVSWGLREEETLEAMRGQLKQYATGGKKFFMTYVPAAPHYPYEKVPERFHKYKPVAAGDFTPHYLNELLYMDWVMASLVDELKESGLLNKTLVIITDDHGEMLGGKGKPIGHGWLLSPELVNAPLIIMDPDRPGATINPVIGCQVDILPTVLDRLGIQPPTGLFYEGYSLDRAPVDRLIYLNSYQQYAVIDGKRIAFGDREKESRGAPYAGECYVIENEGARTKFGVESRGPGHEPDISKFDSFQEALLKNYNIYARSQP